MPFSKPAYVAHAHEGSLKTRASVNKEAVYIEEQWEDILQKKGYVVDETKESDWHDTVYTHPNMTGISVTIHEGGGDESRYVVELNGQLLEQGENPDTLWRTLDKATRLYRESIKHPRELNDEDKAELQSMGIIGSTKTPPLQKRAIAAPAQYDYEANGGGVVLISPRHTTKLLEGEEANDFWVALDHLEDSDADQQEIQALIKSFMDKPPAPAQYRVQLEASHGKLKAANAPVFISGVQYKNKRIEKFRFTANLHKAMTFSRAAAVNIQRQLVDFRLGGSLKPAG